MLIKIYSYFNFIFQKYTEKTISQNTQKNFTMQEIQLSIQSFSKRFFCYAADFIKVQATYSEIQNTAQYGTAFF